MNTIQNAENYIEQQKEIPFREEMLTQPRSDLWRALAFSTCWASYTVLQHVAGAQSEVSSVANVRSYIFWHRGI